MFSISDELKNNSYPGRGIVMGRSEDGQSAVAAYFIMGRSENSRNRIFVMNPDGSVKTQAFDESKVTDPSLIIYNAVKTIGNKTVVTNGDQTDTICELMDRQQTFELALRTREFEPDAPNYTPRISGIIHNAKEGGFNYALSILKTDFGNPKTCLRFNFAYNCPTPGFGHFIHTYKSDGDPLESFEGEPKKIKIEGGIDNFASLIWDNLNEDNKVSLFVRYIDVKTGSFETRIKNKNA